MSRSAHDLDTPRGTDWRERAVCATEDPELWYPLGIPGHRTGDNLAQEQLAKSICAACPVRRDCADTALKTGDEHGISGGLNEVERTALIDALGIEVVRPLLGWDLDKFLGLTRCGRGHPMTKGNSIPRTAPGRAPWSECKACQSDRKAAA